MIRTGRLGLIGLMLISICSAAEEADRQECTGEKLPLINPDQVIEAVTCITQGNVLKLTLTDEANNEYLARVLLPDGRLRLYLVDGSSGNLIEDQD